MLLLLLLLVHLKGDTMLIKVERVWSLNPCAKSPFDCISDELEMNCGNLLCTYVSSVPPVVACSSVVQVGYVFHLGPLCINTTDSRGAGSMVMQNCAKKTG